MTDFQEVDKTGFKIHPDIVGEDDEDTELLLRDAECAIKYVSGLRWAPPIKRLYLAWGIGRVLCVFLVKFARPISGQPDDEVWVVVGDGPSVYLDTFVQDVPMVLETYCSLMDDWADAVLDGGDLSKCYPVDSAPTREHAEMLKTRIKIIREDLLPYVISLHNGEAAELLPGGEGRA